MEINLNVQENQKQIVQEIINYAKGTGEMTKDTVFYCLTCYWRLLPKEEEMWKSLSFEDISDFLFDIITESIYLEHREIFYETFRLILPTLLTKYGKIELLDEILVHFNPMMKSTVVDIVEIQDVSEIPKTYLEEIVYYPSNVKKWIKTRKDLEKIDAHALFCNIFRPYSYKSEACNHLLDLGILDFIDKSNSKIVDVINGISHNSSDFYKLLMKPGFKKIVHWNTHEIMLSILEDNKQANIIDKISVLSVSPYSGKFRKAVADEIHGRGEDELIKICNEIDQKFGNSLNEDQLYAFTLLPELQLCMDNYQLREIYKKSNTKNSESKNLKNFIEILRFRKLLKNV